MRNCANLARVEGTAGPAATGGVAGRGEGDAKIINCFSYRAAEEIPLCGDGVTITNSYYRATENSGSKKTAEAFQYGEVAYLLEGGETEPHNNIWTQGAGGYPVFGTDSVYKLTLEQPAAPYEQGTVGFAEPSQEISYKLFDGADGAKYTYLPGGGSLELQVEFAAGHEQDEVLFTPEGTVSYDSTTEKYTAALDDKNIILQYRFWAQVAGDFSWYTGQSSPYTIDTEAQLLGLAAIVNGTATDGSGNPLRDDFSGKTINLGDNITITAKWTPIGTATAPFAGPSRGIIKLSASHIMGGNDYQGLFGYINNGTVQNVTWQGVSAAAAMSGIAGYVGQGNAHQLVITRLVRVRAMSAGLSLFD